MPKTHPLRYDNKSDVKMRLLSSILRYRGEPCFCCDLGDDLEVYVSFPHRPSLDKVMVHSSDVELDVTSINPGWINSPKSGPLYVMRNPWRQQKQGFNIRVASAFKPGMGVGPTDNFIGGTALVGAICNALVGKYSSFEECLENKYGGAFAHDWAIATFVDSKSVYVLYHKSIAVGLFIPKKKTFFFTKGSLTKTRKISLGNHVNLGGKYFVYESY